VRTAIENEKLKMKPKTKEKGVGYERKVEIIDNQVLPMILNMLNTCLRNNYNIMSPITRTMLL
jgi:lipopolysaccharide biosynthesis regulator YciM